MDDETRARVITNVAAFYSSIGDLSQAAQLTNQQVSITKGLGHRLGEMIGLLNLGYQYVLLGLFEMGKSSLEQAFRLSQTIGAVNQSAYCKLNLGLVYTRLGDFKYAQEVLEDSISVLLETGDSFGQAAGYAYLALALESSGDLDNAARYFSQSQQLYASIGSAGCEIDALAGLARCNLALEDLTEAKRNVTEIWNYLDEQGPLCLEFPIMTYLSCVYSFDATGDSSAALAAIQAGYDDLLQRAGKISDLIWRESFLNNIPEHREIKRLWETRVGNENSLGNGSLR
jgi:tetratricopeptide (TPR) repeat protein